MSTVPQPALPADAAGDRRSGWTPPPRPEWVARANEEGAIHDLHSVVPLDSLSLLDSARRNTGLDDFGADDWREPFEVFVKSLDEEAELNLIGRLMSRSDILMFLEGRLEVEDWYRRHPEIEDEDVRAPLLITGQGRSGTSGLQNLIAADPANGTTMTWEVMLPAPPPEASTYAGDPRRDIAHRRMSQWNRVSPEMAGMHDWSGYQPTENIHLQCMSFQSPVWLNILGQVPSYNAYMGQRSLVPAFAYEKRVLKYLQWRNPRTRWVLKTPVYLDMMPSALEVYPDARFVWIHRDPIVALSSAVAVAGTLNIIRSDRAYIGSEQSGLLGNLEAYASAEMSSITVNRVIDWLEAGVVPRAQLCNVHYADFVRDPVGLVRQIYAFYGIQAEPAAYLAMEAHAAAERAKPHERHRYEFGTPEQIAHERAIYRRYQAYFDVASEVG